MWHLPQSNYQTSLKKAQAQSIFLYGSLASNCMLSCLFYFLYWDYVKHTFLLSIFYNTNHLGTQGDQVVCLPVAIPPNSFWCPLKKASDVSYYVPEWSHRKHKLAHWGTSWFWHAEQHRVYLLINVLIKFHCSSLTCEIIPLYSLNFHFTFSPSLNLFPFAP